MDLRSFENLERLLTVKAQRQRTALEETEKQLADVRALLQDAAGKAPGKK